MTMTQRFAGAMRRHADALDRVAIQSAGERLVQAEVIRQAALHMESLQRTLDAERADRSWRPMSTAPRDGTGVLVLLDGDDMPLGARWLSGPHDRCATPATKRAGWHLTWDGWPVPEHDGPLCWMPCPGGPDIDGALRTAPGEEVDG